VSGCRPVVVIVGPTAAGKSAVAIAVAQQLDGEVINADAMQLYVGMDIGTAKVSAAERATIPHHLLDIWPVTQRASVVDYQQQAVLTIAEILERDRTPVVVGGSGLYVRALIDDLVIPPTDPDVRARWDADLADRGPAILHAQLATLDPTAAAGILASNGRRIVRALEVVELTGSYSATLPDGRYRYPATVQIGLDAADLDDRIAARVRQMFDDGLVEEVHRLEGAGLRGSPTASKALGYAQVLAATALDTDGPDRHLDRHLDQEALIAETNVATRRFARRQRSWFRRDDRIAWTGSVDDAIAEGVAAGRAVR
jgi:tRNA dimethylallyltransferase